MALINPLPVARNAALSHNAAGAFNGDSIDMAYGVLDGAQKAQSPAGDYGVGTLRSVGVLSDCRL